MPKLVMTHARTMPSQPSMEFPAQHHRLLEGILFVDLLMELTNDGKIGDMASVIPRNERWQRAHMSVLAVTCSGVFLKKKY
jgi:hypothetical protein